jgi:hypothetical protein
VFPAAHLPQHKLPSSVSTINHEAAQHDEVFGCPSHQSLLMDENRADDQRRLHCAMINSLQQTREIHGKNETTIKMKEFKYII